DNPFFLSRPFDDRYIVGSGIADFAGVDSVNASIAKQSRRRTRQTLIKQQLHGEILRCDLRAMPLRRPMPVECLPLPALDTRGAVLRDLDRAPRLRGRGVPSAANHVCKVARSSGWG